MQAETHTSATRFETPKFMGERFIVFVDFSSGTADVSDEDDFMEYEDDEEDSESESYFEDNDDDEDSLEDEEEYEDLEYDDED